MKEAFRAYLLADTAIAALIGDRAYWQQRERGEALPCVVLTRVSGSTGQTHGGADNLVRSRIQVNCLAATRAAADALERAVMARLNGKAFAQDEVTFSTCQQIAARDLTEAGAIDTETVFCPSLDFLILHKEV
jgi:hypothetical protein